MSKKVEALCCIYRHMYISRAVTLDRLIVIWLHGFLSSIQTFA